MASTEANAQSNSGDSGKKKGMIVTILGAVLIAALIIGAVYFISSKSAGLMTVSQDQTAKQTVKPKAKQVDLNGTNKEDSNATVTVTRSEVDKPVDKPKVTGASKVETTHHSNLVGSENPTATKEAEPKQTNVLSKDEKNLIKSNVELEMANQKNNGASQKPVSSENPTSSAPGATSQKSSKPTPAPSAQKPSFYYNDKKDAKDAKKASEASKKKPTEETTKTTVTKEKTKKPAKEEDSSSDVEDMAKLTRK